MKKLSLLLSMALVCSKIANAAWVITQYNINQTVNDAVLTLRKLAVTDGNGTTCSANQFLKLTSDGTAVTCSSDGSSSGATFSSTVTVQGNAFSVGGSTLVVTGGRVGILTASPSYSLDVNGSMRVQGSTFIVAGSTFVVTDGRVLLGGIPDQSTFAPNMTASDFLVIAQNSSATGARANILWGKGGLANPVIASATNGNGDRLTLYNDNTQKASIGLDTNADMWFAESNTGTNSSIKWYMNSGNTITERMRLWYDGSLAIGSAIKSGTTLDISGDAQFGSGVVKSTFSAAGDLTVGGVLYNVKIGSVSSGSGNNYAPAPQIGNAPLMVSAPAAYYTPPLKIIDSLDGVATAWTVGGSGCSSSLDVNEVYAGSQTYRLYTNGNATLCTFTSPTYATPIDLQHMSVYLPARFDGFGNVYGINLILSSDANFANYLTGDVGGAGGGAGFGQSWKYPQEGQWDTIPLNLAKFTVGAGSPNLASINKIRIQFKDTGVAGSTFTLHISALAAAPEAHKCIVDLSDDNGNIAASTAGVIGSTLAYYGLPWTLFVTPEDINTPGTTWMNWTQVQELARQKNVFIGLHCGGGGDESPNGWTTDPSTTATINHIQWCQSRMAEYGLSAGMRNLVYPHGSFNPAIEQAVKSVGISAGTIIDGDSNGLDFNPAWIPNKFRYHRHSVSNAEAATFTENQVTQCENHPGVLSLLYHNVNTNPTSTTDVGISTFTTFITWLAGEANAGRVEVRTMADYLENGPPLTSNISQANILSLNLSTGSNHSGAYTVSSQESSVFMLSSLNSISTATLHPANAVPAGHIVIVYKADASTTPVVILPSGSDTFGGTGTKIALCSQGQSQALISNGNAAWYPAFGAWNTCLNTVGAIGDPTSATTLVSSDTYYVPFTISQPVDINQAIFTTGVSAGTMTLTIYSYDQAQQTFNLVVSSPTFALPAVGRTVIKMPDTHLMPGQYYYGVSLAGTVSTITRTTLNNLDCMVQTTAAYFAAPFSALQMTTGNFSATASNKGCPAVRFQVWNSPGF